MKRIVGLLAALVLPALAAAQVPTWNYTTIPPTIASGTVLGNNVGSVASPTALTNPTISGLSLAAQTLAGGGAAFGPSNSLIYGTPSGFITISGQFATPSGADSQISPAFIYIKSDTADVTTLPTGNKSMNWFTVDGNVSTGSTGGRTAIFGKVTINGVPTTITVGYAGVEGIMNVASNMGGSGVGCPAANITCYNNSAGQVYAMNANAFSSSGATFIQNLNAQENDCSLVIGSSSAKKHCLTLVQGAIDSLNGYIEDSAFLPNAMQDRYNLTFTAQLLTNAVTGTLAPGSGMTPGGGTGPGGTYAILFQNSPGDRRYVTISGADPSLVATWSSSCGVSSCGLTANGTNTPTLAGNIAPWNYVIDFGGPTSASASWVNTTLIGGTPRTIGPNLSLVANKGIDWTQFSFVTSAIATPGFTVDPNGSIAFGQNATYPSWTTSGIGFAPNSVTYTDSTASGTVVNETVYAFPGSTVAATNTGVTISNLSTLLLGTPVAGTNVTATNLWSLQTVGAARIQGLLSASAGASIFGGAIAINGNSTFNTTINVGTSTGVVHIADGTGANTVDIGNTTGPTTVAILGTTSIGAGQAQAVNVLTGGSSGALHVDDATGNGTLSFGNDTGPTTINMAGTINLGNSGTHNVTVLGGGSTGGFNVMTGTGNGTFTVGNSASTMNITGTLTVGSASGQNVTFFGSTATGNFAVNTGTGSGTMTFGNSTNTGKTVLAGLSTGTAADVLCLTSGNVVILQAAGSCTISSLRFKAFVRPWDFSASDLIEQFRPVGFFMRYPQIQNRDPNFYHHQVGLTAENVAEVVPDCALYERDMATPKGYRPECITALLIKAQQEEHQRVLLLYGICGVLSLWCAWLTYMQLRRR